MKHSKLTKNNNTTGKKRVLGLLTVVSLFFFINCIQMASAKSNNLLKANLNLNKKLEAESSLVKERSQISGIEEQDISINILNNETYFIGSAQGKIKLKQNQINVKNKNYYGSVLNVVFNETQVKNITEQRKNNTQINLSPSNHLNDFFEYFPNFGKMKSISEMELDLRYVWNCSYVKREEANSVTIVMDLISKESATQHGFKVEFRFNSEKNTKELLRDYFENLMKVCVTTQKSATELKRELHKLIVKSINIKKHIDKAGEANTNKPNADSNSNPVKRMDANVFDKNPFTNGALNDLNPNQGAPDQAIQPMPQPISPQDSNGPSAPVVDNPPGPITPAEQPQNNGVPNGAPNSPVVNPIVPQTESPHEPPTPVNGPVNPNGDAGQTPETLAKMNGKVNNKALKVASFLQKRENMQIKNGKKQDENVQGPVDNSSNQLGNTEESRNPNQDQAPAQPIPEPIPQPNAEPPQNIQVGDSDASKNPQGSQEQINVPGPMVDNSVIDGNGVNPSFPINNNMSNNSTVINIDNNNNLNNNNNVNVNNFHGTTNSTNEKHFHRKETIVSDKADNQELKPENITDPMARQKYQKAQSELNKNKDKLKLLADKKKEIVKNINDLYNKINSELQSKDILQPIAEMDKKKLDKAQQVIEQAKQETEQIRKQSENFLAQKQALNSTQEAKMKEAQALERSFQEQKGKLDEINQKKKDTAETISQYNSNGELAAKKLKANMEKKVALQKEMEKLQMSLDKTAKEIEEKSQDIKSTQQAFDNLTNKVDKLKNEIKLFEESQKSVSKKQDDIGKQIDTPEAEKLKKQGFEALTKLSALEPPLEKAKKEVVELVDSGVLTVIDNSFNFVVDKDNNDLSSFEREMSKIPKFVWAPKK